MDKLDQMRGEVEDAAHYILSRAESKPKVGVIIGSELSSADKIVVNAKCFDYEEIPFFPISLSSEQPGKLYIGEIGEKAVALMHGRAHYYEGYTMKGVVFPVRVFRKLGIKNLILSDFARGLNPAFQRGDLMLITDHLNLTGDNPLTGPNDDETGPRFLDMAEAYSPRLLGVAKEVAKERKLNIQQGVYAGVLGPSFETRAEVSFLQKIGADAVGMSIVAEVIAARHAGIEVLGISCIMNDPLGKEAGLGGEALNKDGLMSQALYQLIEGVIGKI